MMAMSMEAEYANGYVAVPRDHPLFGKDYDDVDICVVIGTSFNVYPATDLVGFPILFEDSKLLPGINCEIIRVRNNG